MGSTLTDVLAVNDVPQASKLVEEKAVASAKEPLCKQKVSLRISEFFIINYNCIKMHKKIIDKGIPEDAMTAWKNEKSSLPPDPLHGMLNKMGGKVRLTFKLEVDQVWLGTKERTEKISMSSIRNVISEPIVGKLK